LLDTGFITNSQREIDVIAVQMLQGRYVRKRTDWLFVVRQLINKYEYVALCFRFAVDPKLSECGGVANMQWRKE
jgi:hypothetical protein